jgi:hypothetical protein
MTDNRIFVAALSGLLAIIGAIIWYLDSPVASVGAQQSALEGLILAMGGAVVAISATVAYRLRPPAHL